MNKSWLTAIGRKTLPAPTNYLLSSGLLKGRVLDYGCGRCKKINTQNGIHYNYDPHYEPEGKQGQMNVILCNYVLNVVNFKTRLDILQDLFHLLDNNGIAYLTVRRDITSDYNTKLGTFQYVVKLPFETFHKTKTYEMYKISKYDINEYLTS